MAGEGKEFKKAEMIEVEKRIYQVGLMLRRKPTSFIVDFCKQTWNIERGQANKYIKKARAEWKKYFEKLKGDGIAYHIAQNRDLKDMAFSRKVVIGTVDNKQVKQVPDLNLILDITKEEAKLMGIYPAEKHDIKVEGELKLTNAKKKLVERFDSLIAKRGKRQTTK